MLPTGAPVNATVAQVLRAFGPQHLCSMHQKCFALLVLRSLARGRLTSPTSKATSHGHRAFGPVPMLLRSHSRCAALQHTCCAPCAKSLRLLALRSTGAKPTALHLCDVRTCTGPLALCMCSLSSVAQVLLCSTCAPSSTGVLLCSTPVRGRIAQRAIQGPLRNAP